LNEFNLNSTRELRRYLVICIDNFDNLRCVANGL